MKVENMTSSRGNKVTNQFIITGATFDLPDDRYTGEAFQSYQSVIVLKAYECGNTGNCHQIFLDVNKWDYSVTTGKYRNQFLGETKAETQKKINAGVYKLVDLNEATK